MMSLVSSKTNAVQSKIHCLFESTVVESVPSKKRQGQNFKVVASETISKHALGFNKLEKIATEKIDGTCCFVDVINGLLIELILIFYLFFTNSFMLIMVLNKNLN